MAFQPAAGVDLPLSLGCAPWRLSGVVVGALLNDPGSLQALGDAVHAPPYKAPPRAPVLAVYPRHCLRREAAGLAAAPGDGPLVLEATLGLVIAHSACRVPAAQALRHVGGWLLAACVSLPLASHYRPAVHARARDGCCLLGSAVAVAPGADPAPLTLTIAIDGQPAATQPLAGLLRPAARLLAEVSDFMTLQPGDVLLLGGPACASGLRAGQAFAVHAPGLPGLHGRLPAPAAGVAA